MTGRRRGAFTLVELIMVIAIVAIVMAMAFGSMRGQSREEDVRFAAEQFALFCAQTKARAMAQQMPFGVAINIQNDPDGTGAILNNRTGGHWYRAVGPYAYSAKAGRQVLVAGPNQGSIFWDSDARKAADVSTFPELVEKLRATWTGPKVTLAAKRVRFLALGDTDEGARVHGSGNGDYGYTSTYPRPWFGYFDTTRNILYPWGGYNPELHASEPWSNFAGGRSAPNYSGFFYQGSGPAMATCRSPDSRSYNVDWDHSNSISGSSPIYGPETGYVLWQAGDPRPLVNADWQDFIIVFLPDGRIYVPPFKTNRKRFKTGQFGYSSSSNLANGVLDTTRAWSTVSGFPNAWNDCGWNYQAVGDNRWGYLETAEVGHFDRHTGAWRVTFAPDASDDRNSFPSVREAMESITPAYRVELSRQGGIRTYRVRSLRDDAWLAGVSGRTPWPSSPDYFTNAGARTALSSEFRFGWPHTPVNDQGAPLDLANNNSPPERLIPDGVPITDVVTPRMMTGKVWWLR
ncbi:MAG: prepilin-type N-terminal cleavage/methylation domain-containing protein [Planctomycetes bacterium]|nr:prepilin-type N-terminal cleavage/methylation domain-containing protein [Planctomycetota bacterium]